MGVVGGSVHLRGRETAILQHGRGIILSVKEQWGAGRQDVFLSGGGALVAE